MRFAWWSSVSSMRRRRRVSKTVRSSRVTGWNVFLHSFTLLCSGLVAVLTGKWNCALLAVHKTLEAEKASIHGGYIVFRRSDWGRFAHVLHTFDFRTFTDYSPFAEKTYHPLPPIGFDGYERTLTVDDVLART